MHLICARIHRLTNPLTNNRSIGLDQGWKGLDQISLGKFVQDSHPRET